MYPLFESNKGKKLKYDTNIHEAMVTTHDINKKIKSCL